MLLSSNIESMFNFFKYVLFLLLSSILVPFQILDEQKEIRSSKKNSQDDNIELLKEEAMKQKQYADNANDYKQECEARLLEILKAVEKIYK